MDKTNLAAAFARFSDTWSPKIVGEVNDAQVKLAKLKGEFVWHHHADEDELFHVVKGRLRLRLRERDIDLREGECLAAACAASQQHRIVPRGVEHLPVAVEECHVLFLEPKTMLNTGNVVNERTVKELERL